MNFEFQNVKWGISEKKDGSMKFNNQETANNRKKYLNSLNINKIVCAGQEHGNKIAVVSRENENEVIPEVDGLITNERNLFLSVSVADCIPIYFYDSKKMVVAIAHAGWRGVIKNIAGKIIEKMAENFLSNPKDVAIHIGPHLQKCHFEVKEDVESEFHDYKGCIIKNNNRIFINLRGVIKAQLIKAGINEGKISESNECTFCGRKYFSFRRDKPQNIESMTAYIGFY